METLVRIMALIRKEFLALFKDRRSRMVVIIPPLIQTIVFGYAATFDVERVPCAVMDEDRSGASRELLARLEGSRAFRVALVATDARLMTDAVDRGDVVMALRIPQGFERAVHSGAVTVQAVVDGRNSNTGTLAVNYLQTVVAGYNETVLHRVSGAGPPANLVMRAWYNPNLLSRWFFVPGILAMVTLVVTLLVTALSVAREREQGTFDQLLVAPYRPAEVLVGKAVPGMVIGLVEVTGILCLAVYWFDVPMRGSLLTLYAGLGLFLFSVVGVGLMVSSLAATMQQGLLGTFLFTMPAVILSGFATPVANMADGVRQMTVVNPLRYILVIIRSVFLEGADAAVLARELWPLAAIGLFCMTVATWLFRRRVY